jgi:hypothetical protein
MPSEHVLIFTSTILELLVLLFVGYEVIVAEVRHSRPMTGTAVQPQSIRRGISMRLGLFIVLISGAIWATIVIGYDRVNSVNPSLEQSQELSQLSDIVTALVKIPWIDDKLREFDAAAKQYEQTYEENIRKKTAELDSRAADKIAKIANDILKQDFALHQHPHFDANHFCCYIEKEPLEPDIVENFNSTVDEHNTASQTIHEIRQAIMVERAKYQAIIDRLAQK